MSFLPRFSGWLAGLFAALILISAGLYNGFPLVTSDSGTYLDSAIRLVVPEDRPITYGLFVRLTSLKFSLWLVIFAQGLLLAWLLLRYVQALVPRLEHSWAAQVGLVGFITWLTGVSWFCSQLMPDIFTAIGVLALGLLLMGVPLSRWARVGLLAAALLAALMHSSNLLTFSLVVIGFGAVAGVTGVFRRGVVSFRNWLVTAAVVLAGWVVLPGLHATLGGGFAISRASSAFLMARLVEAGVMDKFLSRNCDPADQYRLCAFRDKLPNDAITFMWDGNSPLYQTGGVLANQEEYSRIIRRVLTSPRYYPYLISETMQAGLRQLTHIGHGDGLFPFRENTNPFWKVGEFTHYELKEYMSSMQNRGQLEFTTLSERTYASHLLALGVLALLLLTGLRRFISPTAVLAVVVLGLGVTANAFVTGGLANVLDRLQSRVAWVVPFVAVLLLVQYGPVVIRPLLARLRDPEAR